VSNNFFLTKAAKANLKEIGRYTENLWGVKQRDIYLGKIFQCFANLVTSPLSGKLRDDLYKDMRSIRMEKHIIYYYYINKTIQIAAILHERMDTDLHLNPNN
jgi:toxin ParE1/3/4